METRPGRCIPHCCHTQNTSWGLAAPSLYIHFLPLRCSQQCCTLPFISCAQILRPGIGPGARLPLGVCAAHSLRVARFLLLLLTCSDDQCRVFVSARCRFSTLGNYYKDRTPNISHLPGARAMCVVCEGLPPHQNGIVRGAVAIQQPLAVRQSKASKIEGIL